MESALITALIKLGPPWVMVAILLYLFISERKDKRELAKELSDLSKKQVEAFGEFNHTLQSVEKDVEAMRRTPQ
jgi:hypothetical protein